MAAFEYVALDDRGKEQKGILEADSNRQVRQMLRDRGLAPLAVEVAREKTDETGVNIAGWFTPSLSVSERALVTRQMATLIAAGLPVEEALLAVSRQSESPRTHKMLAAGESAGHLDLVLNRLADFTETQQQARSRIQQALVYPVILFLLTIAILAGLLGYVVPDIVEVFADTGQQLPLLTRAIIALSDFVASYGVLIFILTIVIVIACKRILTIPSIRLMYDRRLLHLPIIAKLSRGINTSQFSSTLAILSSSGVPLVEALRIAGEVLSNTWLKQKVAEATASVSEGASLNGALDQSGYFPPMMLHMIASGEASGELDSMLQKVATYMQQDVESLMGVLLSLFGPLMLIIMGGAVFTIVMAILLPIINLNQLVI